MDSPEVVTTNADWTPIVQSFGGVEMVLVPPGCFMMGSSDGTHDEKPVHQVCFGQPFWIDRTEVTNGQFAQFGGVAVRSSRWTDADRPRETITWFEARDFCAERGARLPTEAEWEYAARGPDGLVYPWGNTFEAGNVVYSGNAGARTANVGSRPGGISWVGALDMSGNVWEWTSSVYRAYPYQAEGGHAAGTDESTSVRRVLRGGSYFHDPAFLRAADRSGVPPDHEGDNVGFRCAHSLNETSAPIVSASGTPIPLTETLSVAVLPEDVLTVSANADWTPVIQPHDGVDMALVPPGCFGMGSDNGNDDEKPVHQICFDQPFWIDRTEVTNRQFMQFGGVAARSSRWTDADRPRETITWFEAREYCARRVARLPTEAEWEYAARGPDSLVYPWGSAFTAENVVSDGNPGYETSPVASRLSGESWVGALDISGNVWEWTSSLYQPYPYNPTDGREADTGDRTDVGRVLRGGSWGVDQFFVRSAFRFRYRPDIRNSHIGFRCARSS